VKSGAVEEKNLRLLGQKARSLGGGEKGSSVDGVRGGKARGAQVPRREEREHVEGGGVYGMCQPAVEKGEKLLHDRGTFGIVEWS